MNLESTFITADNFDIKHSSRDIHKCFSVNVIVASLNEHQYSKKKDMTQLNVSDYES